jgi:hypothetical protein
MPVKNPKEVFTTILSDVRQSTERASKIYEEITFVERTRRSIRRIAEEGILERVAA